MVTGIICMPSWQKYILEAGFPLAGTEVIYKRLRPTMGKEFPGSYKIKISFQRCFIQRRAVIRQKEVTFSGR